MSGTEVGILEDLGDEMTAVVPHGRAMVGGLLRPVAGPEDVLHAQEETRTLVERALQKDRDYGVIPGTGSKPTLLKPGAERINAAFGAVPKYHVIESEVDHDREVQWSKRNGQTGTSHGLYRYVMACELIHRESGVAIGHGIGSCSTMESKYVDRPRDSENTVLKMAEKRALIAATLNAYGLSDQFTQDIEDAPELYQPDSGGSHPAPASEDTGLTPVVCETCGGPVWDNRVDKASGKVSAKYPDWKCRDKACGWAGWDNSKSKRKAPKAADPPAPGSDDGLPF